MQICIWRRAAGFGLGGRVFCLRRWAPSSAGSSPEGELHFKASKAKRHYADRQCHKSTRSTPRSFKKRKWVVL